SKAAVTLVVPVRNNPEGVARLLDATTTIQRRIVIDDASTVPLPNSSVRHYRRLGPAAARNTGWRRVDTPLVAFVDSDVLPAADWLDYLLPLFDDPAVGAAAPRVHSFSTGPVGHYEARRSALDMG